MMTPTGHEGGSIFACDTTHSGGRQDDVRLCAADGVCRVCDEFLGCVRNPDSVNNKQMRRKLEFKIFTKANYLVGCKYLDVLVAT